MIVTSAHDVVPTTVALGVENDVRDAEPLGGLATRAGVSFDARRGRRGLWIVASTGGRAIAGLRAGWSGDDLDAPVTRTDTPAGVVFEFASALGAQRAKVTFPAEAQAIVRCTTSVLPARDVAVPFWPRDLYVLGAPVGTVHTAQRGLRSGIVFASASDPVPCTLFYFQNFSSSTDYFEA